HDGLGRLGPCYTLHGDHNRFCLLVLVVACELLTILITWSLWETRESPVNLPLIAIPIPFQIALAASLILVVMRPRIGGVAHAVVLLLACIDDQYRLQPQMICFAILILALIYEHGLWFGRWYLVALWGWTGLHKLLSPEWLGAGSWTYLSRCGIDSGDWHIVFAVAVAVVEIAIAVAAVCTPRRAAIGCAILHTGVLISLSPLVRNHNPSVWPWNFAVAVIGFWILTQQLPSTNGRWKYVMVAATLIIPAGFYFNLVNPYIAHVLYSGNKPQAYHTTKEGVGQLDGYNGQSYPLPNSRRLFTQIFERTGSPGDKLYIYDPRWGMNNQYLLLKENGKAAEIDRTTFYFSESNQLIGVERSHYSVAWRLRRHGVELEQYAPNQKHEKLKRDTTNQYYSVSIPAAATAEIMNDVWRLPNLEKLSISKTKLDLETITGCAEMRYLDTLQLDLCDVAAEGWEVFAEAPALHWIQVSNTSISAAGFQHIVAIEQLTVLRVVDSDLNDDAVRLTRQMPNLTWLDLKGTKITSAALTQIQRLPALTWLDVSETAVGDTPAIRFAELPGLQILTLSQTQITDATIRALSPLQNLEQLEIAETQTTDAAVDTLITLRNLTELDVRETGITEAGVARIRGALPACNIRHANIRHANIQHANIQHANIQHHNPVAKPRE
ncbi:MAG: hypothetical protein ACI9HK_003975, partial [Pirellulaceae bacterium]